MKIKNRTLSCFLALCLILSSFQMGGAETSRENLKENSFFSKLQVSSKYGQIVSKFEGKSTFNVILLQDIHCHFEVQLSIAHLLGDFARDFKEQLKSVYMEGASGPLDFSFFKDFPDHEIKKDLALFYLRTGRISGAEYFALTDGGSTEVIGADDIELYFEDLSWFQEVLKDREQIDLVLKKFEEALFLLETKILNSSLRAFLKVQKNYDLGSISLQSYLDQLEHFSKKTSVSLRNFKNIQYLLKAFSGQEKIDEKLLQNEITKAQNELLQISSSEEKKQFITKALSFKLGKLSTADYFLDLSNTMREKKIGLNSFPNFQTYLKQCVILQKINQDALTGEFEEVSKDLSQALAHTEDEQEILRDREILKFLKSFYHLELNRKEFLSLKHSKNKFSFLFLGASLKNIFMKNGLKMPDFLDQPFLVPSQDNVQKFYTIALKRDGALIENALKHGSQVTVLITGGFHTQGIARQLKAKGISYVIVQPRVEHINMETPYLAMMKGEKSPLEHVMENELNALSNPINLFKTSPGMLSVMGRYQAVDLVEDAAQTRGLSSGAQRLCVEKARDLNSREKVDLFFLKILTALKIWFGKISKVQRIENWFENIASERGLVYEDLNVEKIGSQLFVQMTILGNIYGFVIDERSATQGNLNSFDQSLLEETEFLKLKEQAFSENPPLISRFFRTISEYKSDIMRGASFQARAFAFATAMVLGLAATGAMAQPAHRHAVRPLNQDQMPITQGYLLRPSLPEAEWNRQRTAEGAELVLLVQTSPHSNPIDFPPNDRPQQYVFTRGGEGQWLIRSRGHRYLQYRFGQRVLTEGEITPIGNWTNSYALPAEFNVPEAPAALASSPTFNDSTYTLSWPAVDGVTGYEIRRFDLTRNPVTSQNEQWVLVGEVSAPHTTYTISSLRVGAHRVQVLPYNGNGPVESRVRGPAFELDITIQAPPRPENLGYDAATRTLEWDVVPGLRYVVEYATTGSRSWNILTTEFPVQGQTSIRFVVEQNNVNFIRIFAVRGDADSRIQSSFNLIDISRGSIRRLPSTGASSSLVPPALDAGVAAIVATPDAGTTLTVADASASIPAVVTSDSGAVAQVTDASVAPAPIQPSVVVPPQSVVAQPALSSGSTDGSMSFTEEEARGGDVPAVSPAVAPAASVINRDAVRDAQTPQFPDVCYSREVDGSFELDNNGDKIVNDLFVVERLRGAPVICVAQGYALYHILPNTNPNQVLVIETSPTENFPSDHTARYQLSAETYQVWLSNSRYHHFLRRGLFNLEGRRIGRWSRPSRLPVTFNVPPAPQSPTGLDFNAQTRRITWTSVRDALFYEVSGNSNSNDDSSATNGGWTVLGRVNAAEALSFEINPRVVRRVRVIAGRGESGGEILSTPAELPIPEPTVASARTQSDRTTATPTLIPTSTSVVTSLWINGTEYILNLRPLPAGALKYRIYTSRDANFNTANAIFYESERGGRVSLDRSFQDIWMRVGTVQIVNGQEEESLSDAINMQSLARGRLALNASGHFAGTPQDRRDTSLGNYAWTTDPGFWFRNASATGFVYLGGRPFMLSLSSEGRLFTSNPNPSNPDSRVSVFLRRWGLLSFSTHIPFSLTRDGSWSAYLTPSASGMLTPRQNFGVIGNLGYGLQNIWGPFQWSISGEGRLVYDPYVDPFEYTRSDRLDPDGREYPLVRRWYNLYSYLTLNAAAGFWIPIGQTRLGIFALAETEFANPLAHAQLGQLRFESPRFNAAISGGRYWSSYLPYSETGILRWEAALNAASWLRISTSGYYQFTDGEFSPMVGVDVMPSERWRIFARACGWFSGAQPSAPRGGYDTWIGPNGAIIGVEARAFKGGSDVDKITPVRTAQPRSRKDRMKPADLPPVTHVLPAPTPIFDRAA